jgi:hypothetical protein
LGEAFCPRLHFYRKSGLNKTERSNLRTAESKCRRGHLLNSASRGPL